MSVAHLDTAAVDPTVARDAVRDAVDLLARADLDRLDDRGLLEHTVDLDREITRLQAHRARALAAVDRRGAYAHDGCVTTGGWLKLRTRRDGRTAARMATTARRLAQFPQLSAALARGDVLSDHVEQITIPATPRRQDTFFDHEATLVKLARAGAPGDVKAACRAIVDQIAADGTHSPPLCAHGPDERRRFDLARTVDGLGDLRAILDPVTADRLEALLAAMDQPPPAGADPSVWPDATQRRHDAFDAILRAAETHPDTPQVHGARPHVLLMVDLLSLLGNPDAATRRPRLASGAEIDLNRILELLDHAKLTPILMWGPYRPVGVGRTRRTLPAWLRPLLQAIHRTCRGPGCDRPIAWTQAAHLHGWNQGGATDLLDTLPACPGHHQLLDRAGWTATHNPQTATVTWTSPDHTTTIQTHPPDP